MSQVPLGLVELLLVLAAGGLWGALELRSLRRDRKRDPASGGKRDDRGGR